MVNHLNVANGTDKRTGDATIVANGTNKLSMLPLWHC